MLMVFAYAVDDTAKNAGKKPAFLWHSNRLVETGQRDVRLRLSLRHRICGK